MVVYSAKQGGTVLTAAKLRRAYCGRNYVVQRYIMDPLLLGGAAGPGAYKFDFRVWLFMARADPWVVYYRDGHIRRAVTPFAKGGREAHIANSFRTGHLVGKKGFSYYNYLWGMVDLQRYLAKHYETDNPGKTLPAHFVRDTLRPYLKQVLRFVFLAGAASGLQPSLKSKYKPGRVNCWGLDFVLDADLGVHLLEGNGGPASNKEFHQTGAGDMPDFMWASAAELAVKVQMEAWPREQPPLHGGGWELAYNEAGEACQGNYDPCGVFVGKSTAEIARAWPYAAPDWPPAGAPFAVSTKGWYGNAKARNNILAKTEGMGLLVDVDNATET
jgi:hypothetical protein